MSKWEEETIYRDNHISLIYYRRYIDDIILLWEGTWASLEQFLNGLDYNDYGLRFTATSSLVSINYLDLNLFKSGNRVSTRTYFKSTDRNAFVPVNSCHHPKWLSTIPKGQYMRIRRNCDTTTDFQSQSLILTEKFKEKGYLPQALEKTALQVATMDREQLLTSKKKAPFSGELAFFSGFHRQYKSIENIFKKYWSILLKDNDLVAILPPKPKFVYRRAPGLRNMIAPNVPDPPPRPPTFLDGSGFHYCTRCKSCKSTTRKTRKITKFKSNITHREYTVKPLITCDSHHVTYLLECPCPLQYVGRTTRKL